MTVRSIGAWVRLLFRCWGLGCLSRPRFDKARLAVEARMSESTASHCIEAFFGVTQALREGKQLLEKK
jgi:hypothetical protein